ncbi:MAG: c-type cytochrome [Campylobacter sp.]|nr:c-type cytochrome [Campylobacter sp.]
MKKIFCFLLISVFAFCDELFVPSFGVKYDENKARLGKKLFFDKRLSPNRTYSCESCHNLYWDYSGTIRAASMPSELNPPSILNAANNYLFYKSGKEQNLRNQVRTSITSKNELNISKSEIVKRVREMSEYRTAFANSYSGVINFENIVDALMHFEKAALSVNSPYDKYINGDKNALTEMQKKGFKAFRDVGCAACHNGTNLGTNVRQQVNFYETIGRSDSPDDMKTMLTYPRYRVPSLRNVEKTAPYLYDGSYTSLHDAIRHMWIQQLSHLITDEEVELIYQFLLSLTGERPRILDEIE